MAGKDAHQSLCLFCTSPCKLKFEVENNSGKLIKIKGGDSDNVLSYDESSALKPETLTIDFIYNTVLRIPIAVWNTHLNHHGVTNDIMTVAFCDPCEIIVDQCFKLHCLITRMLDAKRKLVQEKMFQSDSTLVDDSRLSGFWNSVRKETISDLLKERNRQEFSDAPNVLEVADFNLINNVTSKLVNNKRSMSVKLACLSQKSNCPVELDGGNIADKNDSKTTGTTRNAKDALLPSSEGGDDDVAITKKQNSQDETVPVKNNSNSKTAGTKQNPENAPSPFSQMDISSDDYVALENKKTSLPVPDVTPPRIFSPSCRTHIVDKPMVLTRPSTNAVVKPDVVGLEVITPVKCLAASEPSAPAPIKTTPGLVIPPLDANNWVVSLVLASLASKPSGVKPSSVVKEKIVKSTVTKSPVKPSVIKPSAVTPKPSIRVHPPVTLTRPVKEKSTNLKAPVVEPLILKRFNDAAFAVITPQGVTSSSVKAAVKLPPVVAPPVEKSTVVKSATVVKEKETTIVPTPPIAKTSAASVSPPAVPSLVVSIPVVTSPTAPKFKVVTPLVKFAHPDKDDDVEILPTPPKPPPVVVTLSDDEANYDSSPARKKPKKTSTLRNDLFARGNDANVWSLTSEEIRRRFGGTRRIRLPTNLTAIGRQPPSHNSQKM